MIKFRVWDKTRNEYLSKEFVETFQFRLFKSNFYIFEQFTGLQDKNGKDIYVGDIVEIVIGAKRKFTVIFSYERGQYELKGRDFTLNFWLLDREDREVIGNINENKEMLE